MPYVCVNLVLGRAFLSPTLPPYSPRILAEYLGLRFDAVDPRWVRFEHAISDLRRAPTGRRDMTRLHANFVSTSRMLNAATLHRGVPLAAPQIEPIRPTPRRRSRSRSPVVVVGPASECDAWAAQLFGVLAMGSGTGSSSSSSSSGSGTGSSSSSSGSGTGTGTGSGTDGDGGDLLDFLLRDKLSRDRDDSP